MYTAAEALKQSKSGMIRREDGWYLRFDDTYKLWKSVCDETGHEKIYFSDAIVSDIWLPYDPEPIDPELAEAQKLVGSWVKDEDGYLFKVRKVSVEREKEIYLWEKAGNGYPFKDCISVWFSEARCCVDDPPKEDGEYLVVSSIEMLLANFQVESDEWFFCGGLVNDYIKGDVWYALPTHKGE